MIRFLEINIRYNFYSLERSITEAVYPDTNPTNAMYRAIRKKAN